MERPLDPNVNAPSAPVPPAADTTRVQAGASETGLVGEAVDAERERPPTPVREEHLQWTAAEAAEARYRGLFEGVPDAILVADALGHYLDANPAATALLGYTRDEFLAMRVPDVVARRPPWTEAEYARFQDEGRWDGDIELRRKDGSTVPVEAVATIVQLPTGTVYLSAMRDISVRLQAETDLRGLAVIFESSNDAIVGRSLDGIVSSWNPGAERMYGYTAGEIVGQVIFPLVPPDRLDEQARINDRLRRGERVEPFDTVRVRKDGQLVDVSMTLSPVWDADGRVVAVSAIARDVTDRKRAEEELRRARDELERRVEERTAELAAANARLEEGSRRLSEQAILKADFTAMVAHELGSPIAAIRTLTEMLATGELGLEEQEHTLDAIRSETETLQALVADVQATAVAERDDFTVRPRPTPIFELLAEAAAFNRTLPGNHPLTTLIALPDQVLADPERIGQVLRNLIGNAVKHSAPGTPIELRATQRGDRVLIEVADRGPGIHPDDLHRVFEKFGRGRDAEGQRVPGVGLGLYLSRRLVQAHGAQLTVESTLNVGSVFGFELEVAR
ncbi:MAG: PAS domain S-box protein [Chloroflexota bacterium]|nr:PAS domain S-box protein [Chloroflexota bacterium]